jgi:hypothetical protein
VLLLAGALGLFTDYLGLGTHALWWYGGATAAGLIATLRYAPRWKPLASEAAHGDADPGQCPDDHGAGRQIEQHR